MPVFEVSVTPIISASAVVARQMTFTHLPFGHDVRLVTFKIRRPADFDAESHGHLDGLPEEHQIAVFENWLDRVR
jgi:hypothetical protein